MYVCMFKRNNGNVPWSFYSNNYWAWESTFNIKINWMFHENLHIKFQLLKFTAPLAQWIAFSMKIMLQAMFGCLEIHTQYYHCFSKLLIGDDRVILFRSSIAIGEIWTPSVLRKCCHMTQHRQRVILTVFFRCFQNFNSD